MPKIEGTIDAVFENKVNTRYGEKVAYKFKVAGAYYSGGFKDWGVGKGDSVALEYVVNDNGYNDVTGVVVLSRGDAAAMPPSGSSTPRSTSGKKGYRANGEKGGFPIHPLAYERALDRRNALTNAVNYINYADDPHALADPAKVIEVARAFEAYTTGDLDREAAEKLLEN